MKISRLLSVLVASCIYSGNALAKESGLDSKVDTSSSEQIASTDDEDYEELAKSLKKYFFKRINQGLLHMTYVPEKNILTFPLAGGEWAITFSYTKNHFKEPWRDVCLLREILLQQGTYMVNCVNRMSPEQRTENWNSPEMKLVRFLGRGGIGLPEGTQDNYDFWNKENIRRFVSYREHGFEFANSLSKEYVDFCTKDPIEGGMTLHEIFDSKYK